jgi:hypothetical protein
MGCNSYSVSVNVILTEHLGLVYSNGPIACSESFAKIAHWRIIILVGLLFKMVNADLNASLTFSSFIL